MKPEIPAFEGRSYSDLRHIYMFLQSAGESDPVIREHPLWQRAVAELESRMLILRAQGKGLSANTQ